MEDRFRIPIERGCTTTKEADPNDPRIPPNVMVRRQVLRLFEELSPAEREGLIKALLEMDSRPAGVQASRPTPVERVTVHSVLDQQQNQIGDLHNALQELEARLYTMLQQPPATDAAGAAGNAPLPVMVVDRLFMHNQGIRSATALVHRFLSQVDL